MKEEKEPLVDKDKTCPSCKEIFIFQEFQEILVDKDRICPSCKEVFYLSGRTRTNFCPVCGKSTKI